MAKETTDIYNSAELFFNGKELIYHFKLWNSSSKLLFGVIKENSRFLEMLNTSDVFHMKFYSNNISCPPRSIDTKIKYIEKKDKGKFKGHYLIGFDVPSDDNVSVS
jgi:hypothetical protein